VKRAGSLVTKSTSLSGPDRTGAELYFRHSFESGGNATQRPTGSKAVILVIGGTLWRRARGSRGDALAPFDLVVRDSELLVTLAGDPIPGGWVAVSGGLVAGTGSVGTEPEAKEVLSARGGLITPGLINAHHHIFQNLTRSYAPALGVVCFSG